MTFPRYGKIIQMFQTTNKSTICDLDESENVLKGANFNRYLGPIWVICRILIRIPYLWVSNNLTHTKIGLDSLVHVWTFLLGKSNGFMYPWWANYLGMTTKIHWVLWNDGYFSLPHQTSLPGKSCRLDPEVFVDYIPTWWLYSQTLAPTLLTKYGLLTGLGSGIGIVLFHI